MELNKKNYDFYAFHFYTNKHCFSKEEFYEDVRKASNARKLVKKLLTGKEVNMRLLVNNILMFTNVFELEAARELLMFNCSEDEKAVFKTVFNYLGYLKKDDMQNVRFNLNAAKLLKDMK